MSTSLTPEHSYLEDWRLRLIRATDASGEAARDTAEWLGLSESAYYRRRRGEMPFTAWELVRLSERFGLEVAVAPPGLQRFTFDAPLNPTAAFDEERYLASLEYAAERFARRGGEPPTQLRVSTSDIPIFFLLREPEIATLKRYLFTLAVDTREAEPFRLAYQLNDAARFVRRARAVAQVYSQTASDEVWGPGPLRSLVHQVLLLVESGMLGCADCALLFDACGRVVDGLEAELNVGKKSGGGRFRLWQNRLHSTNSIISLRSGRARALYITFDNPNFISSEGEGAVAYFDSHFEVLRRRSRRVSGQGAQSPARLCAELRAVLRRGRARAEVTFGDLEEEGL